MKLCARAACSSLRGVARRRAARLDRQRRVRRVSSRRARGLAGDAATRRRAIASPAQPEARASLSRHRRSAGGPGDRGRGRLRGLPRRRRGVRRGRHHARPPGRARARPDRSVDAEGAHGAVQQCHARPTRETRVRSDRPRAPGEAHDEKVITRTFVISAAEPKDFPPPAARDRRRRPLERRQVEPDQRARRAGRPRAHVAHAGPHAAHQLVRDRRPTFHLVDSAGLRLRRGRPGLRESWRPLIEAYLSKRDDARRRAAARRHPARRRGRGARLRAVARASARCRSSSR